MPDRPTDQLAVLEERIDQARRQRAEVPQQRGQAERAHSAARAERHAHHAAVAAGERAADPDEEARLADAVDATARDAEPDVWDAREAGLDRLIEQREAEAAEHWREHFAAIMAERLVGDEQARRELQEAHEREVAAVEAYAARDRWHRDMAARYSGIDPDDLPVLPTRGSAAEVEERFRQGIEPPSPRSVLASGLPR